MCSKRKSSKINVLGIVQIGVLAIGCGKMTTKQASRQSLVRYKYHTIRPINPNESEAVTISHVVTSMCAVCSPHHTYMQKKSLTCGIIRATLRPLRKRRRLARRSQA